MKIVGWCLLLRTRTGRKLRRQGQQSAEHLAEQSAESMPSAKSAEAIVPQALRVKSRGVNSTSMVRFDQIMQYRGA
jgi:hypothetical protein